MALTQPGDSGCSTSRRSHVDAGDAGIHSHVDPLRGSGALEGNRHHA